MNSTYSNWKGFTLIELLITMGIIVLILSVTLPAFSQFQKEQDLTAAAERLRDALLETQNLALSPRALKPDTGDQYRLVLTEQSTGKSAGYRIEEQVTPTSWQLVLKGSLPSSIGYHHISQCSLTSSGLVYSISQQGRIIEPVVGAAGEPSVMIAVTNSTLGQDEQRFIEVQLETARIDIGTRNPPLDPLDKRLCS